MVSDNSKSHYGDSLWPSELVKSSSLYARWLLGGSNTLIVQPPVGKSPLLVYTGMSGVAQATAIAVTLHAMNPMFKFAQLYIRKEQEEHHNDATPGGYELGVTNELTCSIPTLGAVAFSLTTRWYPVFVDDFVQSGRTFRRCRAFVDHQLRRVGVDKLPWQTEDWHGLFRQCGTSVRGAWHYPNDPGSEPFVNLSVLE